MCVRNAYAYTCPYVLPSRSEPCPQACTTCPVSPQLAALFQGHVDIKDPASTRQALHALVHSVVYSPRLLWSRLDQVRASRACALSVCPSSAPCGWGSRGTRDRPAFPSLHSAATTFVGQNVGFWGWAHLFSKWPEPSSFTQKGQTTDSGPCCAQQPNVIDRAWPNEIAPRAVTEVWSEMY